jgi:hypothetical protein
MIHSPAGGIQLKFQVIGQAAQMLIIRGVRFQKYATIFLPSNVAERGYQHGIQHD